MRDKLLQFLAAREERLEIAGVKLVVRELGPEADADGFRENPEDALYKFITRSTFDEQGNAVFSDQDIPELKRTARLRLGPLVNAVMRVNGMALEDDAKNLEAAPSSG